MLSTAEPTPSSTSSSVSQVKNASCDPAELQNVENALTQDGNNFGVGVVDANTGRIHLYPYDNTDLFSQQHPQLQVMAGHEAAAEMAGIPSDQARGFVLTKQGDEWRIVNVSHLNAADNQPNSMQMDDQVFVTIVNALVAAGIQKFQVL